MSDQFMDDYKRDTVKAMADRIEALEAALREIIAVPTGYHAAAQMEGIARTTLAPEQPK